MSYQEKEEDVENEKAEEVEEEEEEGGMVKEKEKEGEADEADEVDVGKEAAVVEWISFGSVKEVGVEEKREGGGGDLSVAPNRKANEFGEGEREGDEGEEGEEGVEEEKEKAEGVEEGGDDSNPVASNRNASADDERK